MCTAESGPKVYVSNGAFTYAKGGEPTHEGVYRTDQAHKICQSIAPPSTVVLNGTEDF